MIFNFASTLFTLLTFVALVSAVPVPVDSEQSSSTFYATVYYSSTITDPEIKTVSVEQSTSTSTITSTLSTTTSAQYTPVTLTHTSTITSVIPTSSKPSGSTSTSSAITEETEDEEEPLTYTSTITHTVVSATHDVESVSSLGDDWEIETQTVTRTIVSTTSLPTPSSTEEADVAAVIEPSAVSSSHTPKPTLVHIHGHRTNETVSATNGTAPNATVPVVPIPTNGASSNLAGPMLFYYSLGLVFAIQFIL